MSRIIAAIRVAIATRDPLPRFLAFTSPEPTSGCWLWTGMVDSANGYSCFKISGGVRVHGHRFAYERLNGPIPDGLHIDHKCRVRCCVNPDHLEAVTNWENVRRGISPVAINARKTHCHKGHAYTPDNLANRIDGARECLTCRRAWKRARRAA